MIARLKQLIKHYFGFTKTETNATLVLVPLLVLILLAPKAYVALFAVNYQAYEQDGLLLDSLTALVEDAVQPKAPERPVRREVFPFNPNLVSVDSLALLGIPGFIAQRIENYRSKGGRFRVKNDLLKIYDFPDTVFSRLEAHILLPEQLSNGRKAAVPTPLPDKPKTSVKKEVVAPKVEEELLVLNIASADSLALRKIKGIGPAYSSRIVKYRELLGGYHSVSQLKEVYGFSDSLYQELRPHFVCEDYELKQLPINLATFKQLNSHPYISYDQTKEIMNTKSRVGKFKSAEDLLKMNTFDSLQVAKLLPYIDFR